MKQHFASELYDNHFFKLPIVAPTEVGILDVLLKRYQKVSTYMKSCKSKVMSTEPGSNQLHLHASGDFSLHIAKAAFVRNDGFDWAGGGRKTLKKTTKDNNFQPTGNTKD